MWNPNIIDLEVEYDEKTYSVRAELTSDEIGRYIIVESIYEDDKELKGDHPFYNQWHTFRDYIWDAFDNLKYEETNIY
jgi:hypothetical protein